MGICGQEQDIPKRKKESPKSKKSIKDKSKKIKNEVIISKDGFHQLDESITSTSKSLCKIVVSSDRMSSGFLIQLFKDTKKFYCLITNEHVITKEMIKEKITIDVYYDSQSEFAKIKLDPEERLIKEFTDVEMDITVIEIIPKDNIPKNYFLLPSIDYMDNYNKLINKEISIIQYPKGEMKYSYGTIKNISDEQKYEFAHCADTDEGSSGSPVFLKGTTKVIGIHKSGIKTKNVKENFGHFLWPIYTYFKNYSENKNKNNGIKNNNKYNNNESKIINNKNNISNLKVSRKKNEKENNETYLNYKPKVKNIYINDKNYEDKKINNKNLNKEMELENNDDYNDESKIDNIENIDNLSTMTIIYEITPWIGSIRLFGEKFVINNINNCYLLIDDEEIELCDYLELNEEQKKKNYLKIKLIEKNKITNMSNMFNGCYSLKELPDISKWDFKNVTNMSHMFSWCNSLKKIPDIPELGAKIDNDISRLVYDY